MWIRNNVCLKSIIFIVCSFQKVYIYYSACDSITTIMLSALTRLQPKPQSTISRIKTGSLTFDFMAFVTSKWRYNCWNHKINVIFKFNGSFCTGIAIFLLKLDILIFDVCDIIVTSFLFESWNKYDFRIQQLTLNQNRLFPSQNKEFDFYPYDVIVTSLMAKS